MEPDDEPEGTIPKVWVGGHLTYCEVGELHLEDCVLDHFTLVRSRWKRTDSVARVRFVACDLRGASLSEMGDHVHAIVFEECDLDGADLSGLPIAEVMFVRCSLVGTKLPSV